MKLSIAFVPVRKIKPSVSRWNFSEESVEQAAHLVAKVEGVINPLVLRREDNSAAYEVLDGNFEYYVAVRASELAPQACETIAAFIVEPDDEALIREQIELFRNLRKLNEADHLPSTTTLDSRLRQLEFRQADLESRQLSFEMQEIKPLKKQVQELGEKIRSQTNLLEGFNRLDRSRLLRQIKQIGVLGKTAEKIVELIEDERQQQEFTSLKDVVIRVKGLTYEKMVDLIEGG